MNSASSRARLVDFAEVALPTIAGAAYGWQQLAAAEGGAVHAAFATLLPTLLPAALALLLAVLLLGSVVGRLRDPTSSALIGGAVPVVIGCLSVTPADSVLRDPALWCLAVPFAMWCGAVRLLNAPGSQTRTLYRLINTLPLLTLAVPVIVGELHWGIVILPFAVFRIAAKAADQLLPVDIEPAVLSDLCAMSRRTQWIGGAWVAAWAGVLP
jgi:hypothetical protein